MKPLMHDMCHYRIPFALVLKISAWDILYSLIVYNFNYLDTAVSAPTVTAMTAMKSAY